MRSLSLSFSPSFSGVLALAVWEEGEEGAGAGAWAGEIMGVSNRGLMGLQIRIGTVMLGDGLVEELRVRREAAVTTVIDRNENSESVA